MENLQELECNKCGKRLDSAIVLGHNYCACGNEITEEQKIIRKIKTGSIKKIKCGGCGKSLSASTIKNNILFCPCCGQNNTFTEIAGRNKTIARAEYIVIGIMILLLIALLLF